MIYVRLNEIVTNTKVSIGICKNIGIQIAYKKKQKDNPCLILYRKTYQKKLMYAKCSRDEKVKESFKKWKLQARQKVKDFNNGTLKEDDLIDWLKQ